VQGTNAPSITVCVVQLHQQNSPKRYHKTQLEDPPNLCALCSMPYDKRGNVANDIDLRCQLHQDFTSSFCADFHLMLAVLNL